MRVIVILIVQIRSTPVSGTEIKFDKRKKMSDLSEFQKDQNCPSTYYNSSNKSVFKQIYFEAVMCSIAVNYQNIKCYFSHAGAYIKHEQVATNFQTSKNWRG